MAEKVSHTEFTQWPARQTARLRGAGKGVFITLWLIAPIAIVAALSWLIVVSLRSPPEKLPPVGAGAGDAGGANAIGEMLKREASADAAGTHGEPETAEEGSTEGEP